MYKHMYRQITGLKAQCTFYPFQQLLFRNTYFLLTILPTYIYIYIYIYIGKIL